MSIKISKTDIIWNYLGNIMTLGINLFLLPFILRYLSNEELGLWYTFAAVGNIAVLFDFGFKATMGRSITYAWCGANDIQSYDAKKITKGLEPNYQLLSKMIQVTKFIYLIISLLALIFIGIFGTLYIKGISSGFSFNQILLAWVIYILGVFLNLYYGYFNSFLSAVGAIKQVNVSTVAARALQLVIAFILLIRGFGILSMSIAYCSFCIVFRFLSSYLFYKYENIGVRIKKIKMRLEMTEFSYYFKTIWYNAWRDGLVAVTLFLNGQATTLLCSWFLSLEETAVYGLSMQLVNAIASISAIYFSTYQSRMQELYIERDYDNLRNRLASTIFVYAALYIIGAFGVCTLGMHFLLLIRSNTDLNLPLLIVLFIYMFFYKNHTLFASYLAGTNRIIYTKAYIISSITMLILSTLMLYISKLGVWSLAIAPLVVETIYNNWHWPRYVYRELSISLKSLIGCGFNQFKEDIF